MGGKHVAPESSTFLRDLIVMLVGIVAVGVLVFGGLWLLARGDDTSGDVAAPTSTTTTIDPTTTEGPTTSTTQPTTTSSTEPTTTTVQVRDPSEVQVLVLNAVGIGGLAGQVSDQLAQAGYQTLPPDNHDEQLAESRVWYREGFAPEALALAARFPDALVEPLPEGVESEADVVVVLGASYQG